jgi:hypothetical protein
MKDSLKKKVWFVLVFAVLGFVALQVSLTHLAGSKVNFTLFDAFAPIAGSFLGSIPGVIAVLLMQIFNFVVHGSHVVDSGTIIRLLPALFATLYFARKSKLNYIIPILAIIAFNLNPAGRSVWYFSLYWLIPVAAYFVREKSLVAKALGATFSAHAVGGAIWIYAFHLSKAVWIGLIPVVAMERLLFAAGIAASYLVMNNVLAFLMKKQIIKYNLPINRKYVWKWTENLAA